MAVLAKVGRHYQDTTLLEQRAAAKRAGNATTPPKNPAPPVGP